MLKMCCGAKDKEELRKLETIKYHGVFWHPLANNSIRCNPFLALEVSFGAEKFQGGAFSPSYLVIPLTFLSCMCIFYETSTVIGFHKKL